jgi:hypothetical protein
MAGTLFDIQLHHIAQRNGSDPKLVQDLLRPLYIKSQQTATTQLVSDDKREARSGVIRVVTRDSTRSCDEAAGTAFLVSFDWFRHGLQCLLSSGNTSD